MALRAVWRESVDFSRPAHSAQPLEFDFRTKPTHVGGMPTPQLPPIRCRHCDGRGILWDHTDDVEFLRPCVCLQGPDIVEGLAAVQTIVEQAHRDGQRPDALDRLVAT